ncbi:MAG: hypothetical protein N2053_13050, partial [Chitinispirillaceae bacterium]|nr:hypothetical protein [Chitinispirillaceae bacterium]
MRFFKIVTLLIFLLCANEHKSEVNLLNIFENWFTSADSSLPHPLLKLSAIEIDSLVKSIRGKSVKGKGTVIMRDSGGREFVVGFSTPKNFRYDTLY